MFAGLPDGLHHGASRWCSFLWHVQRCLDLENIGRLEWKLLGKRMDGL